jgi:hypothetical protein
MSLSLPASCRDVGGRVLALVGASATRRVGVGRWALAMLVGCLALLVLVPAAMAATSTIKGTVTEAAAAHNALDGVAVTLYGSNESEVKGSASTNVKGEYEVTGLSAGDYKLKFSDEHTYLTQYYDKQLSFASASSLNLLSSGETKIINAELQKPGKIEGVVKNASGVGLAGVDVDVDGSSGEFVRFTKTGPNGEYTLEGLSPNEYTVSFEPVSEGGYLRQIVTTTVKEGPEVDTLDVTLQEGGKISGTVTSALTHAGLAKIGIDVISTRFGEEFFSGTAITNSKGEYTVTGMATGSYKLEFYWEESEAEEKACAHAVQCPAPYITQWYSNQPSAVTANPVTTTVGTTTSGINAAMVPSAPFNTAGPAVLGTPTVGSMLSCSSGSWTGDAELTLSVGWPLSSTFTYQWLREGAPIAGATSAAYLVQTADVGHNLVCEVTATNVAGHTAARSAAVAVILPTVTLSSSKIAVSGGSARVPVACANAACSGEIEITGQVVAGGKGKKAKKETVTLAKGSYSLAAGKKATIAISLTATGRSALGKAKGHKLSGNTSVTVISGKTVKKPVVISEPAAKGTKGKRK